MASLVLNILCLTNYMTSFILREPRSCGVGAI